MPVPSTSLGTLEIIMSGVAAAAGSSAKVIQNVYHFEAQATLGYAPPLADAEAKFQANIAVVVCALLNVRYTQSYNSVRWVNDPTTPALIVPRAVAGAITGDSMSSLDTAYVKMSSAARGKRFRGNKKYGPMSESDSTTTSDIFNAGCIARFATLNAAILAGWTGADGFLYKPVILSRKNTKTLTPPNVSTVFLTSLALNKRIGRLKRREVASVY